ncbi:MAG TPA: FtsX-like permease family protein [Pilimelia sp.]|nr:FtsX-like permease family protein [Pilimelia sp.]
MHRISLIAAGALVTLTAWVFVMVSAVYDGRYERLAARSPVFAASPTASEAVAWWRAGTDTEYERQFAVITLIPIKEQSSPPPGLARWPKPGEAFLSPALARLDQSGRLHARYGTVAGLIGPGGLADDEERLVYRRPADVGTPVPSRNDQEFVTVSGFGAAKPYILVNQATDHAKSTVYRALLLLILPAGALLVIAARSGARRRDARIAMLDALGAPAWTRLWILLGEAAVPALCGALAGGVIAFVTTATGVTLPFSGYRVRAEDLAHARPAVAALSVGVFALLLGVLAALQIPRKMRVGARPTAVVTRVRRWPAVVLVSAMLTASFGALVRGDTGRVLFVVGMLIALATLPVVAGWLTGLLGGIVAAGGNRRGTVGAIVGGRWLAERPAVIARTGAALVIALGLATQAQVMQSQLTEVGRSGSQLQRLVGDTLVQINASPAFPGEFRPFIDRLDQRRVLRLYYEDRPGGSNSRPWDVVKRTTVVGTPAALAALGRLNGIPTRPTAITTAYERAGPEWQRLLHAGVLQTGAVVGADALNHTDRLLVSITAPTTGDFATAIVLNPDGTAGVDRLKQAAYARLVAPNVRVLADDFRAAAAEYASLVAWLLDIGAVLLLMLLVTGVLAAAGVFVAHSSELGPLSGFCADRKLYHAIAAWNLTLPLVAVSLLGSATAAVLGVLLTRLAPLGTFSPTFLAGALVVATLGAVTVGAACGEAANRSAQHWRPTGE